jgi:protein-disulfide isomerase
MQKNVFFALIASLLVFMGFVILSISIFNDSDRRLSTSSEIALGEGVVTVEVTRLVTVIVTPTFTPLPPTSTPLPPEITVDDDPFLGSETAAVKVVEFSDYRCGFCRRFYDEMLFPLTEHYGDNIQFVYRDFPIFGEESLNGAIAAECAGDQDMFWAYHNAIFDNQLSDAPLPLIEETLVAMAETLELDVESWQACFDSDEAYDEVVVDALTAQNWEVTGTPTFFINGKRLVGAQPIENFFRFIDAELVAMGIEPPPHDEDESSE